MGKPNVLFIDVSCPKIYDGDSHYQQAQGGTESTVARVAEGLAKLGATVRVMQHCRLETVDQQASYIPLSAEVYGVSHVVALRTPKLIPWIQKQWPKAKHYLWLHDENYQELLEAARVLPQVHLITVSRYHKTKLLDVFLSHKVTEKLNLSFVYNPLDKLITDVPSIFTTDPNKFIFFSSPHKGLENTLKQFHFIHQMYPESKLYIANPGYYPSTDFEANYIVNLGELSYSQLITELKTASAVLHLQTNFPETFGLVHAEANYLGIPVLTSGLGANREVLNPASSQITDVNSTGAVVKRIEKWKLEGYPKVAGNPAFLLDAVLKEWETLLNRG